MAGASTAAGVPIKLLAEAEGHTVVVELKTGMHIPIELPCGSRFAPCRHFAGEIFRGQLSTAEENMNMQLNTVFHTARDGRVTKWVAALSNVCFH
jgi:small nuclear ribonucleoprotein D3